MATSNGFYRMYSVLDTAQLSDVWNYPNILGQKFPAEKFSATLNIAFKPRFNGEKFGFVVLGTDLAYVSLVKREDGIFIEYRHRINAEKISEERILVGTNGGAHTADNNNFTAHLGSPGKWVGAKIGMFMSRTKITNDAGFTDIDWFRVETR